MQQYKSDVVVVGSGVAGLSFAIQLAKLKPDCKINVLSKSTLDHSNTNLAQGGIASVTDENDTFEAHIDDTLRSGKGLSSPEIVKLVVESAPDKIKKLEEYGLKFTYQPNGKLDLALEGGHSVPRIVHAFDHTGYHVQQSLIGIAQSLKNISFFENRHSFRLIQNDSDEIIGLYALNVVTKSVEVFIGNTTVLATGGSGQVYQNTTNPSVATGDGIFMALGVDAKVSNLEFIQFHPTVLYEKNKDQLDLLTEAIRGFGAYIVNKDEKRFIFDYDKTGELATRDIVSSAIFSELKKTKEECVYLDCRHLDYESFKNKFPKITENLESKDYSISNDLIPIVPAAHYQCGGITVDKSGKTNVPNLFAIGECTDTGLHGVNRLASNSLLEGLVFGDEVASFIATKLENKPIQPIQTERYFFDNFNDDFYSKIICRIKETMTNNATISTSFDRLEIAKKILDELKISLQNKDIKNCISIHKINANSLITVALEIVNRKLIYTKPLPAKNQKIIR